MVKNHHLAKSIQDSGVFFNILAYKAVEAGKQVVRVNPHNTSQICSGCGALVKKGLSVRIHQFPHCGLNIDRDINAARNILQFALRQAAKNTYRLGRGLRGWSRSSRLDEPRSPGINSKVISHQF